MTISELKEKYLNVPNELKQLRRWVCYDKNKIPMSALNGKPAQSTNPLTWTSFENACFGCQKFNFYGLGFILGKEKDTTYFGIDLDNHPDKETGEPTLTEEEFNELSLEFVDKLNSYTEYSHSGKGVHIICKGNLPDGARRRANCPIEMYDSGRFFTMTGNTINACDVKERTQEIIPLWEKYLNVKDENNNNDFDYINTRNIQVRQENDGLVFYESDSVTKTIRSTTRLDDIELINKIKSSKNGYQFIQLYNGNMDAYGNDHSAADQAFCNILAFWTACDPQQMDRIFRSSGLMRPKWDEKRGKLKYGQMTIEKAINNTRDVYEPVQEIVIETKIEPKNDIVLVEQENGEIIDIEQEIDDLKNIDEFGDVILRNEISFVKQYDINDTGNAERLYDYFGKDLFRYNSDKKMYTFWDGRTWIDDKKNYIKKYADKTYETLLQEIEEEKKIMFNEIKGIEDPDEVDRIKKQYLLDITAKQKNALRVGNKAGKDAMITEMQHLHNIPVESKEFDKDNFLINTLSGVVDLKTGKIMPSSKNYMCSKNTNCKVSFEEPVLWKKFLHDIFERGNEQETQELVDCIQKAVGYTLSGSTQEQCMFLMYGATGSNGKSTFIEQLQDIMGDYGRTTPVDTLMAKKGSQTTEMLFSFANLNSARFISTQETDEGEKLSEKTIKQLTGSDTIQARYMYGSAFDFKPTHKIWMSTNNKPIIRGQEYAIWRRIFMFPFEHTFTEETKDILLPEKLKAERDKILGWAIQGFIKYLKEGLKKPRCIEIALSEYKDEMNVINAYLKENCEDFPEYCTSARILFEDYNKWAKINNEKSLPQTKFGQEMAKKGYEKKRKSDGYYYVGIKLNSDQKGRVFSSED